MLQYCSGTVGGPGALLAQETYILHASNQQELHLVDKVIQSCQTNILRPHEIKDVYSS